MKQPETMTHVTREEVLASLMSLGEDPTANRVDAMHARIDAAALSGSDRADVVRAAVDAARVQFDATAPADEKTADNSADRVGKLVGTEAWTTAISFMGKRMSTGCTIEEIGDWKWGPDGQPWRSMRVFAPGFNGGGNIVVNASTLFCDEACTQQIDVGTAPPPKTFGAVAGKPQPFVSRDRVGKLEGRFSVTSQAEKETMAYALDTYGFLLKRNERISLTDYADRIAKTYDITVPQNAEVVRVLRQCATYPVANVETVTIREDRETPESRVLDINGRRFAPLDQTDGKPLDGFYERKPNGILLFGEDREPFVFVVANASQGYFFVSCHRTGEGIRYMNSTTSSDEERLGLDTLGYAAERALAESLPAQLNPEVVPSEGSKKSVSDSDPSPDL
ncbi:hypothetical protein R70006_05042 [Paraburkholderia domus]|uniref:hypothetical protein n=1 Tax=Paraburkholderia domus TaxID=2793075 RepID=UPI00191196B4|nr:hypothetical protein [Paraburkholderia domus]MBK5051722.1 hypothetical protein [Burkholderia sp. R-70006]CAE6795260.1 hypothetical protein R70006_05042 [Paraburkholderia domus]